MDDSEIDAFAKGMVPFVREVVAEAYSKTMVPPDVAEQVALGVRMLHEWSTPAQSQHSEARSSQKLIRIERDTDGNLVPIYDEPTP